MEPTRISEHVYFVEGAAGIATFNAGFTSNAAFVVTGNGVVVFDALGTPALGAKLLDTIRSVTDEPVRLLYISHYHADHMYGAQVFDEMDVEIIAPDGAVLYLSGETWWTRLVERRTSLSPWIGEDTRLALPDRYLEEVETFNMGDVDFRAVNLGSAHSEGDLALFVETDRVLLSGDVIFRGRIPLLGSANSGAWLDILDDLSRSGVTAIVPGHGSPGENPEETIEFTREYLIFVRDAMRDAVENWIPFDEAYEAVDWSDYYEYPAFREANRRNAYSVYLSLEQESLK
ncbi:MAG: MBL fold metallo-hydrolase [Gammaproteobacteria bacterium]|nr:MBL fold metallo-hydrolase [Gammaproteobacteria bacterium]